MSGLAELLGRRVRAARPWRRDLWLATARARARFAAFVVLAGCALGELPTRAVGQASREYDVKAALLFNFTRFVEWPQEAGVHPDTPFVIGILGQDPFGPVLDEIVRNERCFGRPIKVERYRNVEAARNSQILFVSAGEEANLPRILRVLRGRPVLTVGDFEGFAAGGGMIRFIKEPTGKIQLRINLEAFKANGLTVSAKLLRVAEVAGTLQK
ncbi:MAG: YfiR family protein [Opitutaceae bacterium]